MSNLPVTTLISPDTGDQRFRQNGSRVLRSAWWIAPALGTHVLQVVSLGANEKVMWIDTARVVTVMTHHKTSGDRADDEFESHTMGELNATFFINDLAIATLLG